MKKRTLRLGALVLGCWWGAHLLLILGHVACVFLYSIVIAPGLPNGEYVAFAQRSGPWFSILFGGPVFYLVGWILRTRGAPHGRRLGMTTWVLYSLTDLAIVLAYGGAGWSLAWQWALSQGVKLLAVWLATRPRDRET